MDKYEFKLKVDEMKALVSARNYNAAAEIAETINWRKIRNLNALVLAGEVFEQVGRYEDSKEILLLAYDKSPIGRNIIYRLAEIAIKTNRFDEAQEYYDEFVDIAPHDNLKYVLKYKMTAAQGLPYKEQIHILEELKEQEYSEEWAYELAYLYHKDMQPEKCVEACDELILWFGDGIYVEKALELKMHYQPLSRPQEEKYHVFRQKRTGVIEVKPDDFLESGEIVHEAVEIPSVQTNTGQYNTANLQKEIAKGMQQIHSVKKKEPVQQNIYEDQQRFMQQKVYTNQQPMQQKVYTNQQQSMQQNTYADQLQQSLYRSQSILQNAYAGARKQEIPYMGRPVSQVYAGVQQNETEQQNAYAGVQLNESVQQNAYAEVQQNETEQQNAYAGVQLNGTVRQNAYVDMQLDEAVQEKMYTGMQLNKPVQQNIYPGLHSDNYSAQQNLYPDEQPVQNPYSNVQLQQNVYPDAHLQQNLYPDQQLQEELDAAQQNRDAGRQEEQEVSAAMTMEEIQAEWEKTKQEMNDALQEAEGTQQEESKERSIEKAEQLVQRLLRIVPQLAEQMVRQGQTEPEPGADGQYPSKVQQDLEQAGRIVAGINQLLQDQIDHLKVETTQEQLPEIPAVSDPTREMPQLPENLLEGKENGVIGKVQMNGNSLNKVLSEKDDNPVMSAWKEATPGISAIDLLQRVRMERDTAHTMTQTQAENPAEDLDSVQQVGNAGEDLVQQAENPNSAIEVLRQMQTGNSAIEVMQQMRAGNTGSAIEVLRQMQGRTENQMTQMENGNDIQNIPAKDPGIEVKSNAQGAGTEAESVAYDISEKAEDNGMEAGSSVESVGIGKDRFTENRNTGKEYSAESIGINRTGNFAVSKETRVSMQNISTGIGDTVQNMDRGMETPAQHMGTGIANSAENPADNPIGTGMGTGNSAENIGIGIEDSAENTGIGIGTTAQYMGMEKGFPAEHIGITTEASADEADYGMENRYGTPDRSQEYTELKDYQEENREQEENRRGNAEPELENEQDNIFLAVKPRFLTQAQLQAGSVMDGKKSTQITKEFSKESMTAAQSESFYNKVPQTDSQEMEEMKQLTPRQKQIFSYFVPIAGMEAQIYDLLMGVSEHLQYDKHARTGNIIIEGISGSGKTVLIMDIIKALQKEIRRPAGKTGKIDANALNQKDLDVLIDKICGGCLIIESAGKISRETAVKLSKCMERDHAGTLYIIEDTEEGIQKALDRDSSFAAKFTEKISIPLFSSDELVEFGKAYANDLNYDIDEMGVLALYKRISAIQKLDHVTTLTEVKEIVDEAIDNAEKGVLKKVFGMLTATRANDDNYIILREKDFEES